MEKVKLQSLCRGDVFTLKAIEEPKESQVYVLNYYDRSSKTYSASKFSDMNAERFFKGSKEVWIGFTF